MNKKDKISMRQYARMCKTTDRTVRVAVKKGAIQKGYDPNSKKIIPDVADKEWGIEFRAKKANEQLKEVSNERLGDLSKVPVSEITIKPNDTSYEADRKLTLIKAQREMLKLKTESGELVNKEEVYKELFTFGKEVRVAFQSLPDRIIDGILTVDRNTAHKMLAENINEVLEKLSNINAD